LPGSDQLEGQPVRVDGPVAQARRHGTLTRQPGLVQLHPGPRAAVPAQHLRVLQPAAHPGDLSAQRQAVLDLPRSLTEDDRWRRTDPPPRGPSAPPDLRFNPLATGIGVFLAVAV